MILLQRHVLGVAVGTGALAFLEQVLSQLDAGQGAALVLNAFNVRAFHLLHPALGRVGMTQTEAKLIGKRVLCAKTPMQRVGRAPESGETRGS